MCGVAGLLGRIDDEGNRRALRLMADALRHRGPDGEGTWIGPADDRGRGCLLAHRRLSILDLSTAADQPMIDPASGSALAYNGEIYNYESLRDELRGEGERFASTGDTEVLLRTLARRGPAGLGDLRGMFALAFWDEPARRLVLARDPLGIKPLYLTRNPDPEGDWTLAFASEVRALLASGLLGRPRLDPAAVASIVWNGFVVGPTTTVVGVELLGAGEVRVLDAGGRTIRTGRSWSIPPPDGRPGDDAATARAVAESVRLHLASDVPLGVFLSGGIDSSAVANLARKASDGPVTTFTLAFEDEELDEGGIARRVAAAIGSEHREVMLTESRFLGGLERALDTLDQPTFDGLNSFYISEAVREAGLKVALAGAGGDELFGGYKSFQDLPRLLRWAGRTRRVPAALKGAAARLAAARLAPGGATVAPQTRWAKLPAMVAAGEDLIALYQLAYALFLPDFQRGLLVHPWNEELLTAGLPPAFHDALVAEVRGREPLEAISVLEQRCFLGERLLRDTDAASMAVSLETRLPLVDRALVEEATRLPVARRFEPVGRKQALRRIGLDGLDPSLFERPKSGFVMPFDGWIRRGLGPALEDSFRDHRAAAAVGLNGPDVERLWRGFAAGEPGLYWSRVWSLYVLVRWCHAHGVFL